MKVRRVVAISIAIVAVVGLGVTGSLAALDAGPTPIKSSKTLGQTRGPAGEKATPTGALKLSAAEIAKVKQGNYTAALV